MLAAFCGVCGAAAASGLQVSPITLSLRPSQIADGLWLSNAGDALLYAQVRVYHWTQQPDGGDQLSPSRGLLISPPILQIRPDAEQFVRVIRLGAPRAGPGATEDAYRLAIDELPLNIHGEGHGLQFVLHYSVPIFIEPLGVRTVVPELQWELKSEGRKAFLQVSNTGNGHAQLAQVSFADSAGHRGEIAPGLLGYVLPGATMRFALRQSARLFAGKVTFEAMVNGSHVTQNASLADPPR